MSSNNFTPPTGYYWDENRKAYVSDDGGNSVFSYNGTWHIRQGDKIRETTSADEAFKQLDHEKWTKGR